MSVAVKICGLSTPEAVDAAIAGGARYVGLIFFAKSPRNISIPRAASLVARLPRHVGAVGVFVDPDAALLDAVRAQVTLSAIQLHGNERPAFTVQMGRRHGIEIWKAIAVKTAGDIASASKYRGAVSRILYDAKTPEGAALPGGMGVRFDWTLLQGARHPLPWALSGGLDAANVADAVRITGATLVDTSSGVESAPGIKDIDKIAAFLKAARQL
ncbi:MAG: phosphoribosylanthranilate isomerase [Sphingomonas sp.]